MMPPEIEILTVSGCASREPTRLMINNLSAKKGLHRAAVREVTNTTQEQAVRKKFPGSPTVRVGGVDVEPAAEQQANYGMG